jgi:hypothetical protein
MCRDGRNLSQFSGLWRRALIRKRSYGGIEAKVIGHHANPADQRRDVVRVAGAEDSEASNSAAGDRRVPSL